MSRLKNLFSAALVLAASSAAFAFDAKTKELTIGTTAGDFAELVQKGLKPELEKKGYRVKLVEFTDYIRPNLALSEGALDLNIFQHKPYLEEFSKEKGLNLAPIAQVPTAPLGLYAGRAKTLGEARAGSRIAVPNDPTNLARALVILQDIGWIRLKKSVDPLRVSQKDIEKNLKQVAIVELEAAQLPRSLADVDYAVINGNYATGAGIALTSALAGEKSDAYINWAVVRSESAQSEYAHDVIQSLSSPSFKAFANKRFAGYKFPKNWKN